MSANALNIEVVPEDHPFGQRFKATVTKYVNMYPILKDVHYRIKLESNTEALWDADTSFSLSDGITVATIIFEDAVSEEVIFHELMHIIISKINGSIHGIPEVFNFKSDLSNRTKLWLGHLYKILEEWVVQLYVINHLSQLNISRYKKFTGVTRKKYYKAMFEYHDQNREFDFNSIPELLHLFQLGDERPYYRLFFDAILLCDDRIPKKYKAINVDDNRRILVDVFQKYHKEDGILSRVEYISLFCDFLNTVSGMYDEVDESNRIIVETANGKKEIVFPKSFPKLIHDFDLAMRLFKGAFIDKGEALTKCIFEAPGPIPLFDIWPTIEDQWFKDLRENQIKYLKAEYFVHVHDKAREKGRAVLSEDPKKGPYNFT